MLTTTHQLLPWHHRPVKNGYPWVAFVPQVGWFFLSRSPWRGPHERPWSVLFRSVRKHSRNVDWQGRTQNEELAQLPTVEEAAQRAEDLFAQMYPMSALGMSARCHLPR